MLFWLLELYYWVAHLKSWLLPFLFPLLFLFFLPPFSSSPTYSSSSSPSSSPFWHRLSRLSAAFAEFHWLWNVGLPFVWREISISLWFLHWPERMLSNFHTFISFFFHLFTSKVSHWFYQRAFMLFIYLFDLPRLVLVLTCNQSVLEHVPSTGELTVYSAAIERKVL